jgi:DNA-binding winged helix-turn-helix (wHTH) protein
LNGRIYFGVVVTTDVECRKSTTGSSIACSNLFRPHFASPVPRRAGTGRAPAHAGQRKRLRIGSRALDILIVLASRAGEIISKDELVSLVWRNMIVEENNLRVHITSLRKILGEGLEAQQYISNIPNRGYSFVAPVTRTESPTRAGGQQPSTIRPPLPRLAGRIIGREAVLDQLERQLPKQRLLTLVDRAASARPAWRPPSLNVFMIAIPTAPHSRISPR